MMNDVRRGGGMKKENRVIIYEMPLCLSVLVAIFL